MAVGTKASATDGDRTIESGEILTLHVVAPIAREQSKSWQRLSLKSFRARLR
ncbi:MAG: hypothetical protein F6J95_031070 [Leptolyngbya sp. SIO1E4]|nr:hypothetical protein [Leptolyngbya sp. SIO1E4]